MVGYYPHCTFNLNPRASSIDTPLHSFIPHKHVDHMHPNSVIAIAASRRSKELTSEIFGRQVAWTPWLRPGFELGLELERMCEADPTMAGIILGQHGLINWADDGKACYELTLRLIEQAAEYIEAHDKGEKTFGGTKYESLPEAERDEILFELLPWLRGQVSKNHHLDLSLEPRNRETCPLPEYDKERVFKILGREGSIGLQVHGGKKMWPTGTQCRWRNIRIQRL